MFCEEDILPSESEAVAATTEFSKRVSNRIISWVQNKGDILPLKKDAIKKVALVYIGYSNTVGGFFRSVIEEFNERGAEACLFTDTLSAAELRRIKEEYDLTLYFVHLAPHSPYGTAGFTESKAMMFNYITKIDKDKSVAISTESPWVWFDWLPGADRFVNLYGWDEQVLRSLVKGLYGECEFLGKHPFNLNPLGR